jgi:GTP-binding protein
MPDKAGPPRIVDARFVASAPSERLLPPPTGIEIAFAGRSNVGKSTLLNALMGRKGLARTSSTPGCTRELVVFEARTSDDARVTFIDLPGYGYAKRSKSERSAWAGFIEDYLLGRPTLSTVVLLVDVRRGIEEDDQGLLDLIASPARVSRREVGAVVVATKLDKLGPAARKPALAKLAAAAKRPVIGFAESDRETHTALWREIRRVAGLTQGMEPTASVPASSRSQSP